MCKFNISNEKKIETAAWNGLITVVAIQVGGREKDGRKENVKSIFLFVF